LIGVQFQQCNATGTAPVDILGIYSTRPELRDSLNEKEAAWRRQFLVEDR
jgi:hypothetical protein